jgi:hypothetical protein
MVVMVAKGTDIRSNVEPAMSKVTLYFLRPRSCPASGTFIHPPPGYFTQPGLPQQIHAQGDAVGRRLCNLWAVLLEEQAQAVHTNDFDAMTCSPFSENYLRVPGARKWGWFDGSNPTNRIIRHAPAE